MTCGISPPPSAAPAPRRWQAYAVSSRLAGALPSPSRTPSPSSVTALLTAPFVSMLTLRRFRALPVKTRFNGFLFQDCGRPRFRNWLAKSRNRCFDEPESPALCTVALVRETLLRREDFARHVGASGARPRAERRSALRVGCGYPALSHCQSASSRAAEIPSRVVSTSVSSVSRRGSTRRSLRCSVCSVLKLERHGGHGESCFGCGQGPRCGQCA